MARPDQPLSPEEEAAWRALARAFIVVPRVLGVELAAEHGMDMSEYFVLMNLSEEPERSLRMTELSARGSLSLSGMSRVVDRLVRRGLVERMRCPEDARGQLAVLTPAGAEALAEAYPSHLRSVRRHVMDHLAGLDLEALAAALGHIAEDEPSPRLTPP